MAERPNIILIITDQQRYDTINALGYSHVDMPNLDRLVSEGVTFENCFITAPSCAPVCRPSVFLDTPLTYSRSERRAHHEQDY